MHPYKYEEFVKICNSKSQRFGTTRRYDNSKTFVKKPQTTLERWRSGIELIVTQQILDKYVIQFIIEEMQSISIVDKPCFKNLVALGLPENVNVMCVKTLRNHIEKAGQSVKEELIQKLSNTQFIATTADCWTRGKKLFRNNRTLDKFNYTCKRKCYIGM